MSYSDQKGKYVNLPVSAGPSSFDLQYLQQRRGQPVIIEDHAVELLIDCVRRSPCEFHFEKPLGYTFPTARDHAMNCLELGDPPLSRKVRNWINDFLKCADCILLVYLQDVLGKKISRKGNWLKERDLYAAYEALPDENMKRVGAIHAAVYQVRSAHFEHYLKPDADGKIVIRQSGHSFVKNKYDFVRGYFAESMGIMLALYRVRYPDYCKNAVIRKKP